MDVPLAALLSLLKVRQFQNEFMKSSFLPKYKQKIVRISALCSEGRNLYDFLFIFWEKRCLINSFWNLLTFSQSAEFLAWTQVQKYVPDKIIWVASIGRV